MCRNGKVTPDRTSTEHNFVRSGVAVSKYGCHCRPLNAMGRLFEQDIRCSDERVNRIDISWHWIEPWVKASSQDVR